MAITTKTETCLRCSYAYHTEPCQPRRPTDSASAAERIASLTSARSARRSIRPIGSEPSRLDQSNRVLPHVSVPRIACRFISVTHASTYRR